MDRIIFMQSINFEFLREQNESLANLGGLAEAVLFIDPGSALTRLRSFAEEVTKSVYKEELLPRLPQSSFYELIKNPTFKASVDPSLIHQINFLRVQGNDTAHGAEGDIRNAHMALGTAHQLAQYMAIRYYGFTKQSLPPFQDISDSRDELKTLKKSLSSYRDEIAEKSKAMEELLEVLDQERSKNSANISELSTSEIVSRREKSEAVGASLQWDEATTRELMIDAMLQHAHWDVTNKDQVSLEFVVDFPDNKSGKGRADYVLWGDDGQPLAVIEAKKSGNKSLQAGREQARLYADALESMGYQRPVIFYTNGYETFIWDDEQYNTYRPVYGFYDKESLNYLIYQRQYREAKLETFNPDENIAGRPYQIEAIKVVANRFQEQRRKALIIQATGTGKTRVAIALADLLCRTDWAKRVLFLCDRKELRKQADDAFKDFLGSQPRHVVGESREIDPSARIYIATYPGMMNRFAKMNVGFFDLIIADESHRSIYNKYRDLFEYFDALQIGLTATPVKFISRNTFDIFDCEDGDPTFEFGLNDAINNEPPYLVPFRVKDLTTEFLREGIHYNDLDDEQKARLEADLGLEEAQNIRIAGKDIGRKIFSESTDKIILENLMENGIRDETGSLVGKTIIFAQRQDHAEHLEKMFCQLYPQHGAKVCKVIHNQIPKVDSLISEFKKSDNDFRIAISVDMLDTGIDVPEVVNLVFAKPVKSFVKFWQMIGRGTRLCKNLFGQGKDKTEFLIFDHYGNFDFFEEEYQEADDGGSKSLLQHTFESRLAVAKSALEKSSKDGFDVAIALLTADINDLPEESIAVKRELRLVHQLQQTEQLKLFSVATQHLLSDKIAPLMAARPLSDKHAIQFDRLIADTQTCLVQQAACLNDNRDKVIADLDKLAVNIRAVRRKDAVIDEVRSAEFWQNVTIASLERIRTELRGIMKYRQSAQNVTTTQSTGTRDGSVREQEREYTISGTNEAMLYRRRLKSILDDMVEKSVTLQKIRQGETIRPDEINRLASSILASHPGVDLKVLNDFYGRKADQLVMTLRELVGLNSEAVEEHFTQFLHAHPTLTAKQVQFMNLLKNYIAEHGSITIEKLYEAPFINLSHEGIDGVFSTSDADALIAVMRPFMSQQARTAN